MATQGEHPGFLIKAGPLHDECNPYQCCHPSCSKQYLIEELEPGGTKVLKRRKGFTTFTCVGAVAAHEESPMLQSLPLGEKVSTWLLIRAHAVL